MPDAPLPGTLYCIPVPIAAGALHTLSPEVSAITAGLRHYAVEVSRTARRFLRSLHAGLDLGSIAMVETGHDAPEAVATVCTWLREGYSVGLLSEAGCPGVADPGAAVAAGAHRIGAPVVPLVGPSAILLALMGSGLHGQSFQFLGYLPVAEAERAARIAALEAAGRNARQTQIFIETPYRNNVLLAALLKTLSPATYLCIAQNLTGAAPLLRTQAVAAWRKAVPDLPKEPAIFLFLPA